MLSLIAATLLTSAPPAGDLVKIVSYNDARYEFYVLNEEGDLRFEVCVKYVPTGTRIRRSTCASPPPFNVRSAGPQLHAFWNFDPHLGFAVHAEQLAHSANIFVKDNKLTKEEVEQLYSLVANGYRRALPFNPVTTAVGPSGGSAYRNLSWQTGVASAKRANQR